MYKEKNYRCYKNAPNYFVKDKQQRERFQAEGRMANNFEKHFKLF